MTPYIDNIYDVYLKTDEIIYGLTTDENYNEEIRPKDSFIEFQTKFGNWGAKKEYPTILSFIIAIILPIIGLIFVENQAKYKEIKYGKNNGLTILSLTISLLWWIIFIFIISFL